MSSLTIPAVLALALQCQSVVAPSTILKIAQHESSLDPSRIHINIDRTVDVGLLQINSRNFAWLGLTMATALDPCRSIAAGATVLTSYSRYNTGSPTKGIENGYALAVQGVPVPAGRGTFRPPLDDQPEDFPTITAPWGEAGISDRPAAPDKAGKIME